MITREPAFRVLSASLYSCNVVNIYGGGVPSNDSLAKDDYSSECATSGCRTSTGTEVSGDWLAPHYRFLTNGSPQLPTACLTAPALPSASIDS